MDNGERSESVNFAREQTLADAIAAEERLVFTLKESARLCSIGYSTLLKDIRAGKLRPGKRHRILKAELMRYAETEFGPGTDIGRPRGATARRKEDQEYVCPPLGIMGIKSQRR